MIKMAYDVIMFDIRPADIKAAGNDIVADEENDDISIVVSPTDSKESRVDTLNYSEHLVQVGGGIMLTSLKSAHE